MGSSPCRTASPIALATSTLILLIQASLVAGSPPGPVVQCTSNNTSCTVRNAYGAFPDRTICRVASVAYPTNESDLLAVVSNASMIKQKMKVVTVFSHSMPKLSCPGGPAGTGLVISTQHLNQVVGFDLTTMQMTVGSGMRLHDLLDAAASRGLALAQSPYWLGVTIGGLLGTGAHGSSLFGKGSAVHEHVVGMRLVVPTSTPINGFYAKVVSLAEGDPDLLAAKVSLGLLGVISQVTLQLEPMFKRSITNLVVRDSGFESGIANFGASTEFGDLTWYPSQKKIVYKIDMRSPTNVAGNGENDFSGFQAQPSILLGLRRSAEDTLEATDNPGGKCLLSQVQVTTLLATGTGLENNDGSILKFTGYPVIGDNNKLQASGSCLESKEDGLLTACAWDPRINGEFFHQTTISIPLTNITSFINDVKKLRDMNREALCGTELYSGFLMRFVRASSAYLGKTEDALDIDITYYRSHDPSRPRLNEDVLEEIEQMALFKYNALPHWGKNRNIGFVGVRNKYGSKGDMFVQAMVKYDPQALFSSEWTDGVLGLRGQNVVIERNGCALEGLCICSLDSHCAPEKGYVCQPGLVYTQARVCRKVAKA